ncbi:efflux RND transporter periplasmic adaptor subunit [Aquabacterium sp.]|uniref:efflux RND transporter periplasmic adaptor subunit n=1 Tax=Aquabacterium sp. TaxID=1872578 RepID=UPI0019BC54E8|nr:efflux RND transporter periplasmic adaptor subunit [Aquabacterium sp.]MBC7699728.1 efflux RND transporter periplasmic adaptor subunit [Aquabacterium sp.]
MLGSVGAAHAAPPKPAGCLIEPDQVADVGSAVTGIIEKLNVALGERVQAGQSVVVLRADVERANANAATLRTQMDAEVKAAAANLALARQKVVRTQQLVAKDFVSQQALDQANAEMEVAVQKHTLARSQQRIYGQEQAMAQAQLGLRTLRSPINGIVVERYSNLGERVEDRPVLRVANIDPLRVSLMVPITQYGQVNVGDRLSIHPELPGIGTVSATVQYVDKVVDAASNSFRVRLSLPNPDHRLPAGLRCKADWPVAANGAAPVRPAPRAAPALPAPTSMPTSMPMPMPMRSKAVAHSNTLPVHLPTATAPASTWLKMSLALARVPAQPVSSRTTSAAVSKARQTISLRFSIALADVR